MGIVDVDNGGVKRKFFCSYRVIFTQKISLDTSGIQSSALPVPGGNRPVMVKNI
jgi:hypothetical protein